MPVVDLVMKHRQEYISAQQITLLRENLTHIESQVEIHVMTASQWRSLANDDTVGRFLLALSFHTTATRCESGNRMHRKRSRVKRREPVESDLAVDARVLRDAHSAHAQHATLNPEEALARCQTRVCKRNMNLLSLVFYPSDMGRDGNENLNRDEVETSTT